MDEEPLELEFSAQPAVKRPRGRPRKEPVPTSVIREPSNIPTGSKKVEEKPELPQVPAPQAVETQVVSVEMPAKQPGEPKKKLEEKPVFNSARRRG